MGYLILFVMGFASGIAALLFFWWNRLSHAIQREKIARDSIARASSDLKSANELCAEMQNRAIELEVKQKDFQRRVVSYDELNQENRMLKQDLQNIDVNLNKLQIDHDINDVRQKELSERSHALAKRYLKETVKLVIDSIGPNNYTACKQKLVGVIEAIREIGYEVTSEEETELLAELKEEFEKAVRASLEREEQARIKAQVREEQRLERELEREREQIERERLAIQKALDKALAESEDKHSQEIESLQEKLADAEQRAQRNMSMAQQTRAGNVYVISNIGSFGDGVFKIGMTRRLEPMERVNELGSASVPFPFDVHMMISCKDAPALENALHRELHRCKINRANPRKEFFKTDIEKIAMIVEQHHGRVEYVANPEALEYRQTLAMPEEDAEFIEMVYDKSSGGDRLMVED